jgi:AcrR family transcriptional regulator
MSGSEILKAAKACFARFGYEKTTLDDIGKMVGLNKASLYYYYKNKEAIFAAVILWEVKESLARLNSEIHGVKGCRERLLVYQRERIRVMQSMTNLHSLSMETFKSETSPFQSLGRQVYEKEMAFLNEIIQACVENGEFKPCDTKRVAESILTVASAIKLKAHQGADVRFADIDYQQIEDETLFTVSLILDGLSNTGK